MFSEFVLRSGQSRSSWADRIGVSRAYLSDLLNGKKRPGLDLAVKIERLTNGEVPAASWIPKEPETPTAEPPA